jgi:hypothetical protein
MRAPSSQITVKRVSRGRVTRQSPPTFVDGTSHQLRDGRFQITPTMILPLPKTSLYKSRHRRRWDQRQVGRHRPCPLIGVSRRHDVSLVRFCSSPFGGWRSRLALRFLLNDIFRQMTGARRD